MWRRSHKKMPSCIHFFLFIFNTILDWEASWYCHCQGLFTLSRNSKTLKTWERSSDLNKIQIDSNRCSNNTGQKYKNLEELNSYFSRNGKVLFLTFVQFALHFIILGVVVVVAVVFVRFWKHKGLEALCELPLSWAFGFGFCKVPTFNFVSRINWNSGKIFL